MPAEFQKPITPPPPLAVNDREAARLLGVSPRTMFTWRKEGRGPRFKREGSRVMYAVAELRRYLNDYNAGGPAEGGGQ